MRISDWSSDVCSSDLLAVLVNCQPREIIWTSGGTESNNLALKGVTDGAVPSRVLYGATEHPAVLEAAESLHERGWIVETVAVDETGVIDWSRLGHQLKAGAVRLVSLMRANNETGVIHAFARARSEARRGGKEGGRTCNT